MEGYPKGEARGGEQRSTYLSNMLVRLLLRPADCDRCPFKLPLPNPGGLVVVVQTVVTNIDSIRL